MKRWISIERVLGGQGPSQFLHICQEDGIRLLERWRSLWKGVGGRIVRGRRPPPWRPERISFIGAARRERGNYKDLYCRIEARKWGPRRGKIIPDPVQRPVLPGSPAYSRSRGPRAPSPARSALFFCALTRTRHRGPCVKGPGTGGGTTRGLFRVSPCLTNTSVAGSL
jgi:hypothetical protein